MINRNTNRNIFKTLLVAALLMPLGSHATEADADTLEEPVDECSTLLAAQTEPAGDRATLQSLYVNASKFPLLTPEQEIALYHARIAGDPTAVGTLVKHNTLLVARVVLGGFRRLESSRYSRDDLIQEGLLGLMHAARNYNPYALRDRGEEQAGTLRFSHYAIQWIHTYIFHFIQYNRHQVKISYDQARQEVRIHKAEAKLTNKLHRPPTTEELASELKMSASDVEGVKAEVVQEISGDHSHFREGEDSFFSSLPDNSLVSDPGNPDFHDPSLGAILLNELKHVPRLKARDLEILRYRFGIDDAKPKTLEQVAERFGLTRERVRQIIGNGLRAIQTYLHRNPQSPLWLEMEHHNLRSNS